MTTTSAHTRAPETLHLRVHCDWCRMRLVREHPRCRAVLALQRDTAATMGFLAASRLEAGR
ncbi:MAG TPA: hypothetical protein VMN03_02745 [Burkholderiales bacterium]|nr:hypothetical protein [Burkholderiales bacterium]